MKTNPTEYVIPTIGNRRMYETPSEDRMLVVRAQQDPEAFGEIMRRYQEPLLRYIRRLGQISKEDAEDLLQEAFIKMYRKLSWYDPSLKFSSWAYRIVHNQVVDHFRKSGARAQTSLLDIDEWHKIADHMDLHQETSDKDCLERLRLCMDSLPLRYREVLILRFLEEKSYEEMMDILKKPKGSVATLVARGKILLARAMRKNNSHCR